jgi:hypothetical protein
VGVARGPWGFIYWPGERRRGGNGRYPAVLMALTLLKAGRVIKEGVNSGNQGGELTP